MAKRSTTLIKSKEAFRAIVETSLDGIYQVDTSGRFLLVNESFANLFGYEREELLGKHFADMLSAETLPKVEKMVYEVLSDKNVRNEVTVKHKDGHEIPVRFSATPLREQSKIIGLTGILSDITGRKQAEEALREAHDELENRVKERTLELEKANEALQVEIGEHRRAEEAAKRVTREFLTILENSVDMIYRLNLQSGTYDYLSPSSEIVLGYTPEEFIALGFENAGALVHPDDLEMLSENILELIEHGPEQTKAGPVEYRMNHRHLGYRWVSDNRSIIYDDRNMPVAAIGILRDVTERKQAEEALRESEFNYRVLFESQIDGMAVVDAETMKIVLVNDTALKMYGFDSREEALEANLLDYIHSDDRDRILKVITEDMFEKDLRRVVEFRVITKDGIEKWTSAVGTRIEYQGKTAGLASFSDITEQKQAEDALRESEEAGRALLNAPPDSAILTDRDGIILDLNEVAADRFGKSRDKLIGVCVHDIVPPEVAKGRRAQARKVIRSRIPVRFIDERAGIIFDNTYYPVFDARGRVTRIAIFARDITERKKAEQALQESEQKYRELADLLPQIVYETDDKGNLTFVNRNAFESTGYTQGDIDKGLHALQVFIPEDRENGEKNIRMVLSGERLDGNEYTMLKKDGGTFPVMVFSSPVIREGKPVGIRGVVIDITERKRAEEALRESEARFRAIFDGAAIGIELVDRTGRPIEINPALQKILGYTAEEMRSMAFTDYMHPEDATADMALFEEMVAGQRNQYQVEKRYIRKDGKKIYGMVTLSAVRSADGKLAFVIGMLEDITERKRAEEALRQSEERHRSLFDNALDSIYTLALDGTITSLNPAFESVTGWKSSECIGKPYTSLVHPDDLPNAVDAFQHGYQGEQLQSMEARIVSKSGQYLTMEFRGAPLFSEGQLVGFLGIGRDVTERRHMEEELRKREEHFKALIENSLESIAIIDREGAIQYLGPSFERLMGYRLEEYLGKSPFDHVHTDDRARVAAIFAQLIQKSGATVQEEVRVLHKNGSLRTVEVVGQNLLHNPAVGGLVANIRDITERKQAEEKLQALYQQEKELRQKIETEMKKRIEFTRALAHELKTPLTSVMASSDLLVSELVDEPLAGLAKNINQGASNLNNRIDELLDLARGEVGMLQIKREPVDLSNLLREAADSMTPLALGRGQSIALRLPPDLPTVQADTDRLQQIVTNLLNNAVKFTPKGGEITLRAREKDASVIVEVQDTGRGISKKEQERLFEPYQRLDDDEGNLSGLGLGLSLCKTLVELHGGQIWVRSRGGRGSTFGFSLPLVTADTQAIEPEKTAKLWKVLIIEDDSEIIKSVSLTFRLRWPEAQLISTGLGEEGIDMVETEAPDIVILDLGLPDISGFEVLHQIRLFSSVPVIILTVKEDESDMVKGLDWGADDYMVKPFKQLELLSRLKVQLRKQTPPDEEVPIVCGPLRLDPSTFQLTYEGKEIGLTIIEGRIIECLMRNAGHVVTHSRLAETVWGEDYAGALDSLRVYIRYLREKLEANPSKPKLILTKAGVGYSLVKPV